jgi:DOPA 4,5-dioxygenase
LKSIHSYHAHVYFSGSEEKAAAEALRHDIAERFSVTLGRWHEQNVGPHTASMYQVAFMPREFPRLVPWLMLNRRGLSILIHPNTSYPANDHTKNASWLGTPRQIKLDDLPDHIHEAEPDIIPNTSPTVDP